jgi:Flp pilus assembly pilin Flp
VTSPPPGGDRRPCDQPHVGRADRSAHIAHQNGPDADPSAHIAHENGPDADPSAHIADLIGPDADRRGVLVSDLISNIPAPTAPAEHTADHGRPARWIRTATLALAVTLWTRAAGVATRIGRRLRDDRGQATTEYALVLLAAALVALLVVAWATAGGGAARISRLFNRVIDAVIDRV